MVRIVPLALVGVALLVVFKQCGGNAEFEEPAGGAAASEAPRAPGPAPMGRAVLTRLDLPESYAPAQGRRVFSGLRPDDPDCARLLALADLRAEASDALREGERARGAHAAFYRSDPPATVIQHVFRLRPGEATRYVKKARAAAEECPDIGIPAGEREETLERSWMDDPAGGQDAAGVTYSHSGDGAALSMLFARSRDDLLVLGAAGAGLAGKPMERIGSAAVGKLREFQRERTQEALPAAP